jgi:hypothetical protein
MMSKWRKLLGTICCLILQFHWILTFGTSHNLSLLFLASTCLLTNTDYGALEASRCWNEWQGCCVTFHRLVLNGAGLFCANFSCKRGNWNLCLQVWCSPCYSPIDNNEFPMVLSANEDGFVNEEDQSNSRYKVARNGDN